MNVAVPDTAIATIPPISKTRLRRRLARRTVGRTARLLPKPLARRLKIVSYIALVF